MTYWQWSTTIRSFSASGDGEQKIDSPFQDETHLSPLTLKLVTWDGLHAASQFLFIVTTASYHDQTAYADFIEDEMYKTQSTS